MKEEKFLKLLEEVLDRKGFATKDDLKSFATKNDIFELRNDMKKMQFELEAAISRCVSQNHFDRFVEDIFAPLNLEVVDLKEEVHAVKIDINEIKESVTSNDFKISRLREAYINKK